jgi:hypothetical protein
MKEKTVMHGFDAQTVAVAKTGRRALTRFSSLLAAVLILTQGACGGGGVTGPSPLGTSSPSTPMRLTGTWRGGSSNMSFVWQLTQDGQSIVGTSRIAGNGGWSGSEGRVVGTIEGSTLVFDETHAPGTLTVAGCSAQLHGRLSVSTFTPPVRPPSPERNYPLITLPPFRPSPPPQTSMSGSVSGHGCAGDFDTTIVLRRD